MSIEVLPLEELAAHQGSLAFVASPYAPDEAAAEQALRPSLRTTYDTDAKLFVPHSDNEVVAASLLTDMAVFRALGHHRHHAHLSFSERRHGWGTRVDSLPEPGDIRRWPHPVLFATEALANSVRQQGGELRASVFGIEITPDYGYMPTQPFEIRTDGAVAKAVAVSLVTGNDWPEVLVADPYIEPSITTLLTRPRNEAAITPDQEGFPGRQRIHLGTIALQPTTECNLHCSYCYLPPEDLKSRNRMAPSIVNTLAEELETAAFDQRSPAEDWQVSLLLHGGEPLMAGLEALETTHYQPFERLRKAGRIRHQIQTNGTLITKRTCDLFATYDVGVGVSIDGPGWVNGHRVTASGQDTYARTMRGIERLTASGRGFSAIAVVSLEDIPTIAGRMDEYLQFFDDIGATDVGFNIEEQEGGHIVPMDDSMAMQVQKFWDTLYAAWEDTGFWPRIRDFGRVLRYLSNKPDDQWPPSIDLLPTISFDGVVTAFSPELARYNAPQYGNFVVGQLGKISLGDMLTKLLTTPNSMLTELMAGNRACCRECGYFNYCGGGQASNRYFEHGHFGPGAHLTNYCRSSMQKPYTAVTGIPLRSPRPGSRVYIQNPTAK